MSCSGPKCGTLFSWHHDDKFFIVYRFNLRPSGSINCLNNLRIGG